MVHRLRGEGYLDVTGRAITLTPKGQELASSVVRKHRLAERLLTDVIGLEWHKAHTEAGRWEHVISDEVEGLLIKLLDNPTTCPHGNPIPGASAAEGAEQLVQLTDSRPGERVRLARVTEEVELDLASLTYLNNHGFIPGSSGTVRSKAPDGTLVLELDRGEGSIALGPTLASQLYVGSG
jgi:DtxR family Mn-dependent transcriptional regulator